MAKNGNNKMVSFIYSEMRPKIKKHIYKLKVPPPPLRDYLNLGINYQDNLPESFFKFMFIEPTYCSN